MKKLTLLLLLMISTSVFAEWTATGGDEDMTVYVDFETIKRKGSKVKMWSVNDYKAVQGEQRYWSGASYDEYDCEEGTKRMLDLYLYSGSMKQGEIIYSHKNIKEEAESIMPGSIGETTLKIACSNK